MKLFSKLKFFKIHLLGLFLISCTHENQNHETQALYAYQDEQTEYYGLKNAAGKIIIPAQYEIVYSGDFHQALFVDAPYSSRENIYCLPTMIVVKKNSKMWWIDRAGKKLFESFFFDNGPDYFKKGLSRILNNNKFGFINKQGKVVIEPLYDFASPFNDAGFANVCNGCWLSYPPSTKFSVAHGFAWDAHGDIVGGKWGIISCTGQIVVPLVHSSYEEAKNHLPKA